jgi:hypothetical protein
MSFMLTFAVTLACGHEIVFYDKIDSPCPYYCMTCSGTRYPVSIIPAKHEDH